MMDWETKFHLNRIQRKGIGLGNVTNRLRKYREIKWTIESKKYFNDIKKAIAEAHVLVCLDFSKDFIVFSFASKHTIAGVLLQKNQQNAEHPIAFFSKILRDGELKYDIMEEWVYALVKYLK